MGGALSRHPTRHRYCRSQVGTAMRTKVKVKEGDGHATWTDEQIERFRARHPFGSRARLAIELIIAVGARRGDGISVGPQHLKNGWLIFTAEKNRRRKPQKIEVPVPAELAAAIEACPSPSE